MGAGKTFREVVWAIAGLVGVEHMVVHCGQGTGKVMYDFGSSVERSRIGEGHLVHKDIYGDDVEAGSIDRENPLDHLLCFSFFHPSLLGCAECFSNNS